MLLALMLRKDLGTAKIFWERGSQMRILENAQVFRLGRVCGSDLSGFY